MNPDTVRRKLESRLEELASIEHNRWAHWQKYVHESSKKLSDGSLVIPANLAQQWDQKIRLSYEDLSEEDKGSDRDQVRKYLPAVVEAICAKDS